MYLLLYNFKSSVFILCSSTCIHISLCSKFISFAGIVLYTIYFSPVFIIPDQINQPWFVLIAGLIKSAAPTNDPHSGGRAL